MHGNLIQSLPLLLNIQVNSINTEVKCYFSNLKDPVLVLLGHPEGRPLHESNQKKTSVVLVVVVLVVVPVIKV